MAIQKDYAYKGRGNKNPYDEAINPKELRKRR
jgi:hypothetical protein